MEGDHFEDKSRFGDEHEIPQVPHVGEKERLRESDKTFRWTTRNE